MTTFDTVKHPVPFTGFPHWSKNSACCPGARVTGDAGRPRSRAGGGTASRPELPIKAMPGKPETMHVVDDVLVSPKVPTDDPAAPCVSTNAAASCEVWHRSGDAFKLELIVTAADGAVAVVPLREFRDRSASETPAITTRITPATAITALRRRFVTLDGYP